MKKILLIAVCFMASISTMSINAQDNSKNLSQGQWNHGLAIGAQWIATDLGFAQSPAQVVARTNENYTLDDLRVLYGSKDKWVAFYDKLKKHENETGDVDKLVATVAQEYTKGAVIKNKVKSDVEKYNATHTGNEVGAVPAGEPAPAADAATEGSAEVVNTADSTATAQEGEAAAASSDEGGHGGHGWLYLLSILGLALGAIGTFLAMQARKETQAAMHDAGGDINNLQKQIDKLRAKLKGEPQEEEEEHGKHHKRGEKPVAQAKKIEFDEKPANPAPAPAVAAPAAAPVVAPKPAEKKEEPKPQEQPKKEEPKPAFGEPRILFMAKPDEEDNFSRTSSQYEPGNSIFELTTMDGKSGSFTVINKSDAHKLALLMPGDTLTRACSGNNIQSTAGKSRIVTDRAGRAQLENGKWHIVVKAIVHYE